MTEGARWSNGLALCGALSLLLGCLRDWASVRRDAGGDSTGDANDPNGSLSSDGGNDDALVRGTDEAGAVLSEASAQAMPAGDEICAGALDACDGDTLVRCGAAARVVCAAGCATAPTPHCLRLSPTGAVSSDDLEHDGLAEIALPAGESVWDTDSGRIIGSFARSPNAVAALHELESGIAFHVVSGYGVFSMARLRVPADAVLKLVGGNAAALVAAESLVVEGVVDARPMSSTGALCPSERVAGPGGAPGGRGGSSACCPSVTPGEAGAGPGAGAGGARALQGNPGGGGGGGYAASGGVGGPGCHAAVKEVAGGAGGGTVADLRVGGSGGGGGGAADGGGGGGAVHLVAGNVITIGSPAGVAGINVGGCGGKGAAGAGGGGSGGSIALEAPTVQLLDKATLAANGGSGGALVSGKAVDGASGHLSALPALAPGNTRASAGEGNGSAGDQLAGRGIINVVCGTLGDGAGGGGASGRLLISAANVALSPQAVLSPSLASGAARSTSAALR